MKRWVMVILLLMVLVCAGCAGGVKLNESKVQNADTDSLPFEEVVAGAKQPGEISGAEPDQPISDANANANTEDGKNDVIAGAGETEKSSGPVASEVSLWVTRDFAKSQLYEGKVTFSPGDSVMDILKKNLDVKTEYGGGFVESINGLSSGYTGADKKTRDWFYYANGIITSVGALDYKPAPGDVIWWDYHDWGRAVFTPALIGAFPEPFISGYRSQNTDTVILVAPGCEQQGNQLAERLRNLGAQNITVQLYDEKLVKDSDKITLVVGLWDRFAGEQYWQGMQKQRKKTGLFIEFTPEYFATLDVNGKIIEQYDRNVGAITATGSGMGDSTPVWLVTGLDQYGLDQTINVFTTKTDLFKQCFGALITGGTVIAVPVVS